MKDLRNLTRTLILLVASAGLTACDPGDDSGEAIDAAEPPADAPCPTYYPDRDGDGYGDSQSLGEVNCEPFTGTVDNKLDCDDTTRFRRPGHPEVCDGLDNDCNGTVESDCPADCDPLTVNGGSVYLFCAAGAPFDTARTVCRNQGMDLVHINSGSENGLLDAERPTEVMTWIGGSDVATENTWRWVDNSENFWNGLAGGQPVPGVYSNWEGASPHLGNDFDCAAMNEDGVWMDRRCGDLNPFICERTPDSN